MAKRIEIRLTDNPSNDDNVLYSLQILSEFYSNFTAWYFKSVEDYNVTHILIGATKQDTINNFYDKATAFYSTYSFISVEKVTNGINIFINRNDADVSYQSVTGDITLTIVDVTIDDFTRDQIILSRSPYVISLQPTSLFDLATMELKLYRGELDVDLPTNNNYSLSKPVIQAGQTEIVFEVSKFLNDFVKNNIPTFGSTGVHTSTLYDSVWLQSIITAYYLGASIGTSTKKFLAIDGFGYHTELYNPKLTKNVLSTITNHTIYLGSDYPLYFVSKDLVSITINGSSVSFTLDANFNNQLIAYINIGAYASALGTFTAVFNYGATTETHTFEVKEECRNDVYNIFFKNKFGFWQSIPFVKRAKENLSIESSEYMPIISSFGQYSLQSHQYKTTNVDGTDKISLNTDFLNENYNDLFRELMLTEVIYIENNGQYLPVNAEKKTFDFKTKLNDKLIQYSMDFKYSFNVINNVKS